MTKILLFLKKYFYVPLSIIVLLIIYFIFRKKSEKQISNYIDKNITNTQTNKITALKLKKDEQEEQRKNIEKTNEEIRRIKEQADADLAKLEEEKEKEVEAFSKLQPEELTSVFAKKFNLKNGDK